MKNAWHKFQRFYFRFNRSDRNAIIILASTIVILLIAKQLLPYLIPSNPDDFTEIKTLFEEWEKEQREFNQKGQYLFEFNPNIISESKLDSLDLPSFVKQNMLRYRNAGGKFNSAEDFRKIYGMTDSVFQIIQPFIVMVDNNKGNFSEPINKPVTMTLETTNDRIENRSDESQKHSERIMVELNAADSSDLMKLSGIGPVFSKRIIGYRNLLGGYVKKEQLLEVYNFPPETYERISDQLEVDTTQVTKLRINFADFSDLLRHPYLNKEQVSAIVNQRDKNGPFKNLSEVASIQAFDSESFARAQPYLTCK